MSRILLTGGTGVLGRRALPALLAAGHEVTAVARGAAKADQVRAAGAAPAQVDLFDPEAVHRAVEGHDAVVHLATNIPTGLSAATRRGAWKTNDRLRREASAHLAAAAGRYVGESITFPYVDGGAGWIDESADRAYFWGNESTVEAEAAAHSVTEAGGVGVALRFAMFHSDDSAHLQLFVDAARRGLSMFTGDPGGYVSFIDVDDAAAAVVAALDAPAGVYNVAEADPRPRAEHARALAEAVGRDRLRSIPGVAQRLGGRALEWAGRSQRISSRALTEATGWAARVAAVDRWSQVA